MKKSFQKWFSDHLKLGTLTTVHRIYTETGNTNYNFKSKNRTSAIQNVKKMLGIHSLGCFGRSIKKNHGRDMTVYGPPPSGGAKPYDSIMGVSLTQITEVFLVGEKFPKF